MRSLRNCAFATLLASASVVPAPGMLQAGRGALVCKTGPCAVDCRGAQCSLKCELGAQCLLICAPGDACELTCAGTLLACEEGVLACERGCP